MTSRIYTAQSVEIIKPKKSSRTTFAQQNKNEKSVQKANRKLAKILN